LTSFLSVAALGSILTRIYAGEMISSLRTTEQKSNDLIMNDIDGFIGSIRNITESFVLDEDIKDILLGIKQNPSFSNYNEHSQEIFYKLFIYGHNVNREIWRICIYSEGLPYPYISTRAVLSSDMDYSAKEWYEYGLKNGKREVVYGVHLEDGTSCITVARPIYQSYTEALLGFIAIERYSTAPTKVFEADDHPLPEGRSNLAEEVFHHLETGEPLADMLALPVNLAVARILDAGIRSAATGREERIRNLCWTIG